MKKLTRHRKVILENMQARKDHPTAKMVYDSVRESMKSLSFATVYNSLEYLYNNQFIKKLDSFSESAHYDATLENHTHLICKNCERVFDYPSIDVSGKFDSLSDYFSIEDISITIRGTCKECCSK
jgi:Fur family peroxide stress response transcriptional regulator